MRRVGYLLAAAAIVSGLAIVVLWTVATTIVGAPLEPATGTGPGTWGLPAGLRSLLADIEATLADAPAEAVRRLALVPIAAGAALAAGVALAAKVRLPSAPSTGRGNRGRHHLWAGRLEENPDEVITLIIRDAISPAETAEAFGAAGLGAHLNDHESGSPWPTLGELIDGGQRLVVFVENEGSPPGWYHQAFDEMQDTPYQFPQPEDFTCTLNRGDPDAPLLLMNHWVSRQSAAPDRATAVGVNSHEVIVERAGACQHERGLTPNYIAVDFYNPGDVTGALDTLNGVG
jgi:hypothetical protein